MSNTITIEAQNNNYWGANIAISALSQLYPGLNQLYFSYSYKGFRKNY